MVSAVVADRLTKQYTRRGFSVRAVTGATFALERGEVVTLIGPSGSGKSTLLALLIGWERPDSGLLTFPDGPADPGDRRWADVGVLPQNLGLLEELTVAENVLLPARALRRQREFAHRADELMQKLGIAHLAARFPQQTSLGEQQRTGLARAIVLRPQLVIADEPTAHQDHRFASVMLDLVRGEAAQGSTFLIATHDATIMQAADRVLRMSDGQLTESR